MNALFLPRLNILISPGSIDDLGITSRLSSLKDISTSSSFSLLSIIRSIPVSSLIFSLLSVD